MSSTDAPSTRPRLRWHVVYYVLAAFDILTVCTSLYLNYRLTDLYVQAVASNQEWGQFMADYLALEGLAAEASAAGKDVFESRDPDVQARRVQAARAAFRERLTALGKDLATSAPSGSVPSLLEGLREIERGMQRVTAEADAVFAELGADAAAAQHHMREMDRNYAQLLAVFREQRSRLGFTRGPRPVRAPQPETAGTGLTLPRWERFQLQTSLAASLQRWEWAIAGLIAMMVAGAVLYGRRLAGQMEQAERERTRFIDALSEARATLEQRVLERTEDLRRSEADLRRAASEWQHTFEAIASPVLLVDSEGRIVRANRAAAELAGAPAEGPEGLLLAAVVDGAEPWRSAARLAQTVALGSAIVAEEVHDTSSGKTWDVVANRVSQESVGERAIVVVRDVTQMALLQEAVRREERMAAMGSLVAGVAHEVRNPLFGISGTLETLNARLGPDKALEKYFVVLKRDVDRLRALMQDLLDFGKPARLHVVAAPLGPLVADAARTCEPIADGLRVEIRIDSGLPPVRVDSARVIQVFENLLRNALQHSPPGGCVIVEAGVKEAGSVWCSVRDFGPGFPPADREQLFEPFFTKREGGTGLGLSIAQRIVEQHGGGIAAANHPDGGAVVTLTLPVAVAPEAA
jgi:PAS domain S-box-containing protein